MNREEVAVRYASVFAVVLIMLWVSLASAQETTPPVQAKDLNVWIKGMVIPSGDPVPSEFSGALGFNYERKVWDYLALGFEADVGVLMPETRFIQADVGLRLLYPVKDFLEPYLRFNIGGTEWFGSGEDMTAEGSGSLGLNLQVLAGVLFKLDGWGLFVEPGFMYTKIAGSSTNSYLVNVGVAF